MAATPKLTGTSSTGEAQTSLPLTDATPLEQNCDVPASGPIDLPIEVGEHARTHARTWIAEERDSDWAALKRKLRKAKRSLESAYGNHGRKAAASDFPPPLREELLINRLLVQSVVQDVQDTLANKLVVPQIVVGGEKVPRAYVAAKSYLAAVDYQFDEDSYRTYMQYAQEDRAFDIAEVWLLSPMLQLQLLFELSNTLDEVRAQNNPGPRTRVKAVCASLVTMRHVNWKALFVSLSATEKILKDDPVGAYVRTEFASCNAYREAIQELARFSSSSETDIARLAVSLAQTGLNRYSKGSRASQRRGHVGYYLVGRGRTLLERQINYRPQGAAFVGNVLRDAPELFYFLALEFFILGIMGFLLSEIRVGIPLVAVTLLFLLPSSEAAVEAIHQVLMFFLPPRNIPRLDFSAGIPDECATVVAVPTILISEDQVEHLIRSLEVRYLGNVDRNLYFAVLTDSPDSDKAFDEKDALVSLCSGMIEELNAKYASSSDTRFFHLHRYRTFNETENSWMGWERKRGKLLDFNELLRDGDDRFPVKVGNMELLRRSRFVITLDSDTQLPRGSAARLVGAMAHPLNQAILDAGTKTVREGYGVLQPRVGISVQSVNRSRLAYIYSGQTGLDIYTQSVSDVYQDLFGEAIFTGKGIYEVDVFRETMKDRFPSNSILSHDLIEGSYARTGLLSEVEIVDDYPSHFSAYSRRKHRWVRGDWQILKWLFSRVPNANGELVDNPLSVLSRWKILDNLRRSVIEAATFVLFLACWFFLPGSAVRWTAAAVALLLIPSYVQCALTLIRQWDLPHKLAAISQGLSDFVTAQVNVLVFLAFLPHQSMVTLDAITRTVFRLTVTRRKLLEWQTAAQSEMDNRRKTPVDVYLDLTPALTILIAIALWVFRPHSLLVASPILLLWLISKPATKWLDRPLRSVRNVLRSRDHAYARKLALKTWRFFAQFSNADQNWLVPDNIQGRECHVAHRLSTTNLGLLLNSQLAAYHLGVLTLPRFATLAEQTMATTKLLPRFQGHFVNWYDSRTLEPLEPQFVSTVDNGNLACCLWTQKQGALRAVERPLFDEWVFEAITDHLDLAIEAMQTEQYPAELVAMAQRARTDSLKLADDSVSWSEAITKLLGLVTKTVEGHGTLPAAESDAAWWLAETRERLNDLSWMFQSFSPWLSQQFAVVKSRLPDLCTATFVNKITINSLPEIFKKIAATVDGPEFIELRRQLASSMIEIDRVRTRLTRIAEDSELLVREMDFAPLFDKGRHALSVGFDVTHNKLQKSCYDLLASEARSAVFVGIAKNELPQEAWFYMGRTHTRYAGKDVLVSWTGTMFEYLMPALWLKHFPRTLLESTLRGAVDCQRAFVKRHKIPWGISEGACTAKNDSGHYEYYAFGVPQLAMKADMLKRAVITPYASALALAIQPVEALQNLQAMDARGWLGKYGFYESAEFRRNAESGETSFEVVHCWMAHHQGMILISICNLLTNSVFQKLFHNEVRVEATERILHERTLSPFARERVRKSPMFELEASVAVNEPASKLIETDTQP